MANNWEYDKTVSAPVKISVVYTKTAADGSLSKQTAVLTSTQYTETETSFETLLYKDVEGKLNSEDVVVERVTESRNTVAAVNGSYVKWRLEAGLGLPSGDANRASITTYTYWVSYTGPKVYKEVTFEYFSEVELAGSLSISNYMIDAEAQIYFEPSTTVDIVASSTETIYDEWIDANTGRTHTQTKTTRYLAMGLTQEGQQSAAEQLKAAGGNDDTVVQVVTAMRELTCDGTEIRSHVGRAPVPSRPDEQNREAEELLNPDNPELADLGRGVLYDSAAAPTQAQSTIGAGDDDGPDPEEDIWSPPSGPGAEGRVVLNTSDGDSFTKNTTAEYTMPFAPDDYRGGSDGYGDVVPGKSPAAARDYGRMMNMLKAGNAFGCNITTVANRVPSEPFAPVYLNAGGISAGMRLNGTSWAFDQNGLLCSSDLLLCGVAGRVEPVTSSWVRVPVPATSLPLLTP